MNIIEAYHDIVSEALPPATSTEDHVVGPSSRPFRFALPFLARI